MATTTLRPILGELRRRRLSLSRADRCRCLSLLFPYRWWNAFEEVVAKWGDRPHRALLESTVAKP